MCNQRPDVSKRRVKQPLPLARQLVKGHLRSSVGAWAHAQLTVSFVGFEVRNNDIAEPRGIGMHDGDVLHLGRHRLRFWETPHVHHWDSMMAVEETTASLFPSDLFIHPNDQPPIVRENLGTDMCEWYRAAGLFGGADPVLRVVGRVERLAPAWVHPMHGGSMPADTLQGYTTALRTQPFTFDGRLFGRRLPNGA